MPYVFNDTDKDGVVDTNEANVRYVYANNRLKNIITDSTTYSYSYDSFGNVTQISAGETVLVTFTYRSGNGKPIKRTYANGDIEEYTYDQLDRLASVEYNDVVTYTLVYDANGMLARCIDNNTEITQEYTYDSLGRLIRALQKYTTSDTKIVAVENSYDDYGRTDGSTYVLGEATLNYSASYGANSGLISYLSLPDTTGTAGISYSYDKFERLTSETISSEALSGLNHGYEYYSTDDGKETSLVSGETVGAATYGYQYDALGNITKITKNGADQFGYEYDTSGRLIREYNYQTGITTIFAHDKAGNIETKYTFSNFTADVPAWHIMSCYPLYLESEVSYSYEDDNWGDVLTDYNGTEISYDANYNPLNWRNATSLGWTGRTLTSLTLTDNTSIVYSYDAFGVRTAKLVNSTIHRYVVDGDNIICEAVTGSEFYTAYYYYDAAGSVIGLRYKDADYFFQKNWRNDVIGIVNASGTVVAEYTYDAWGKVISVTGSMASTVGRINPFRYRSYYYDNETGFYYLNTRYYDPEVGRFISADTTDVLASSPDSLTDKNLFAYCDNNSVMCKDDDGEFWHILAGAVVGAVVGAVSSVVSQAVSGQEINWKAVGISAAAGAVSGAINAACPGMGAVATGIVEGAVGAVTYAATEKFVSGRDPSLAGILVAGITSGVLAGGAKAIGNKITGLNAKHVKQNIGSPFVGKGSAQIGVDPNTLTLDPNFTPHPGKYVSALQKIKTDGMYGAIEVTRQGYVIDGQHRVYIARKLGLSVDVYIR